MKKRAKKTHKKIFFLALFDKPLLILTLLLFLPFILWGIQQTQQVISFGKNSDIKLNPLASSYGTIDPIDRYPAGDPAPQNHPDLNLAIRGYVQTNGEKYPIVLGEGGDPKAPQIGKILSTRPTIVSLYKIYGWDWATNRKTVPMPEPNDPAASVKQVQMIGLATNAGEEILVPDSGYRIGGNYQVMVIYADENSITVKYGREDNIGIKFGYAIQVEEINVNPDLLNLYRSLNAGGRGDLPALVGGQVMGTAKGNEIRVVIRDTGDFLDPRSKLDWWQGVDYPPVPTDIVKNPSPTQIVLRPTTPPVTQPTVQPTTYNPQPTTYIPSPTTLPQPTSPQAVVVLIPPTAPPIPTSTLTPTPAPFIDIGKAVKVTLTVWENLVTNLIKFSKVILP